MLQSRSTCPLPLKALVPCPWLPRTAINRCGSRGSKLLVLLCSVVTYLTAREGRKGIAGAPRSQPQVGCVGHCVMPKAACAGTPEPGKPNSTTLAACSLLSHVRPTRHQSPHNKVDEPAEQVGPEGEGNEAVHFRQRLGGGEGRGGEGDMHSAGGSVHQAAGMGR